MPHVCELSHVRGAERASLQSLHRYSVLRKRLPLQCTVFQLVQSRVGRAAQSATESRCFGTRRWRNGEMHILRAAHQSGRNSGGGGKASAEGWGIRTRVRADVRAKGHGFRRSQRSAKRSIAAGTV